MNDKEVMKENVHDRSRVKYFFMGGLIAASAALLLAPRSGRETREYLSTKAQEGKDFVYKEAHQMEERFTSGKERVRSEAKDIITKARNITRKEKLIILGAIEAGRQAYREEKTAQFPPMQ